MGLLSFLRREPTPPPTPKRGSKKAAGSDGIETLQRLRQQARRRLLGAAVLVGVGIVAFPLLFETQPRPVPMDLPIVIPAKEATTTPQQPAQAALPASLPDDAELQAAAEPASLPEPAMPPARSSEPLPQPMAQKPTPKPAASVPAAAATARYVVQVGAFADKQSAAQARQKLERKGLKTYAQVAKTPQGDRIRVRLGPFANRAEADKAAQQAKAAGLAGAVLTLSEAAMDSELFLSWADLALAVVLLVSLIVGAVRGFVFEALSLGAWVIAYLATPFLAPVAEGFLPVAVHEGGWQSLAAPVLAFVAVLVLVSLIARLLRALLHATPLKAPDRLLGAGFGLLRGALICLLVGVLIGFTPMRKHPAWERSAARPVLAGTLRWLQPLLPQDLHRLLDPAIEQSTATT